MEYQGQNINKSELPGFVKGLPEGFYTLSSTKPHSKVEGGLVIPKSGLIKAIQSSEIPMNNIRIERMNLTFK